MMNVSVVIPCYNEEKNIAKVLGAIYTQNFPRSQIQVVIADGGSRDRTLDTISVFKNNHQDLEILVVNNPCRHIPVGLNLAIKAASGELIVRMDGHSIPEPDYLYHCVEGHEKKLGDNIGGVWDIQPGGDGWIPRSIAIAASHPLGVGDAGYRLNSPAGKVDTVPFGSYKRELFERIGFFNEALLSNEDYEFNTRIRACGGEVYLDPKIRCQYIARKNFQELIYQYFRYGYWKLQMLRQYPGSIRWRQALPPLFVISIVVFVLLSIFWSPARYLLAMEWIVYWIALFAGTIRRTQKSRNFGIICGVPIAISMMHFSWGGGFIWSAIKSVLRLNNS